jgi:hypothetical protein
MTRLVRLVTLTAASITLASVASAWRPTAAAAADPVTFGTPTATSSYGESIEFKQPIEFSIGENPSSPSTRRWAAGRLRSSTRLR